MRAFATALLVGMAVVYVVTTWFAEPERRTSTQSRAFAEAALVGGLADWFAVTALFRRPLGLPIPHTAIVPARKNQIGRALARFIRDHFLVREAVERRLSRANLAARLGAWLEDGGNAARVSRDLAAARSRGRCARTAAASCAARWAARCARRSTRFPSIAPWPPCSRC